MEFYRDFETMFHIYYSLLMSLISFFLYNAMIATVFIRNVQFVDF